MCLRQFGSPWTRWLARRYKSPSSHLHRGLLSSRPRRRIKAYATTGNQFHEIMDEWESKREYCLHNVHPFCHRCRYLRPAKMGQTGKNGSSRPSYISRENYRSSGLVSIYFFFWPTCSFYRVSSVSCIHPLPQFHPTTPPTSTTSFLLLSAVADPPYTD